MKKIRFIDFFFNESLNEHEKAEFGKTSDFTFKQLKIEGTFGIGIARNEIPDFDEKVKKLPSVLFGSLAKKTC